MTVTVNGTNGLTFADASTQNTAATGFGFKNRIINGAMTVDQRNAGASQTIIGGASTLAFNCDRWQVRAGGANATVQQVATNNTYRMVFTGAASVSVVAAHQSIEAINCADLAGNTVTLSLVAKSTSLTSLTLEAYYANTTNTFGTWGSPTVTSIGTQSVSISTTESTVSWSFTVPSAATTGIQIRITSGALGAGQTLTIGNVQLEKGATATPFDYRPYGTELALCQRYLPAFNSAGASIQPISSVFATATNSVRATIPFPVLARIAPTGVSVANATGFSAACGNAGAVVSAMAFVYGGLNSGNIDITTSTSPFGIGQGGFLYINSSATSQILFTGCEL